MKNKILFGTTINNIGKVVLLRSLAKRVCIETNTAAQSVRDTTNGYFDFIKDTTYTHFVRVQSTTYSGYLNHSNISIVDYEKEMHWITDRTKFITEYRDMKLKNIIGDTADKKQP